MTELPKLYFDLITTKLFDMSYNFSNEDITYLFNLHNNFVDAHNPQYSKSCGPCVKRVIVRLREHYQTPYNTWLESTVIAPEVFIPEAESETEVSKIEKPLIGSKVKKNID